MVAKSADLFTRRIPRRQLARAIEPNCLGAAFFLADRICDLPNIVSADIGSAGSNSVCLLYRSPSPLSLRKTGDLPFCRIFTDRILLNGLSNELADELVEKGWAVKEAQWTMLHMPRDEDEADVCWEIIWRRYRQLMTPTTTSTRQISGARLPQFSRSNHR